MLARLRIRGAGRLGRLGRVVQISNPNAANYVLPGDVQPGDVVDQGGGVYYDTATGKYMDASSSSQATYQSSQISETAQKVQDTARPPTDVVCGMVQYQSPGGTGESQECWTPDMQYLVQGDTLVPMTVEQRAWITGNVVGVATPGTRSGLTIAAAPAGQSASSVGTPQAGVVAPAVAAAVATKPAQSVPPSPQAGEVPATGSGADLKVGAVPASAQPASSTGFDWSGLLTTQNLLIGGAAAVGLVLVMGMGKK
jgi:hypothetical protein